MEFLDVLGPVIVILVIVGVVVAVVAMVRRHAGEEEEQPGLGSVRRLYYYGLAFVALMVAANGAVQLLDYLAESLHPSPVLSPGDSQLALGLSLTLVGTPLWLLFWGFAQRSLKQFPTEIRSIVRKLYMYMVLAVSGALAIFGLVSLLRMIFGATGFEGQHIAFPVVWGGLWLFHWRMEALEGQPTEFAQSLRRLYTYLASLAGLALLALGVGLVLGQLLREAYDAGLEPQVLLGGGLWSDTVRNGLALGLVGGPVWWWHWHRVSRGDAGSVLRQVYLNLFAILGGAATVVVSLSFLLFGALRWLLGEPDLPGAATHFRFIPTIVASLVVGSGLWLYHWAVVRQEALAASGTMRAASRVYRYLVSALGLGTLASGLVMLFALVLALLVSEAREPISGGDWWRGPLALVITFMIVGTPLWTYHWFGVQRQALDIPEERTALSRRVFLYLIFGVAILVALGNLSAVLFMFFQTALEGRLSLEVLRDAKWSLGMLLTAGAISVYYWLVLQEDRQALAPLEKVAPAQPVRKRVIALASETAEPLVRRLESSLGYPVNLWRLLDSDALPPSLTDEELQDIQQSIARAPSSHVLLTIDASGVRVLPYREG